MFVVPLSFSSDAALRAFQGVSKTLLKPTMFMCAMKPAIEAASRLRPPLITLTQPDPLAIPGSSASVVVNNWASVQLRKPPPKAPPKRAAPVRRGGRNAAAVQETPPPVVDDKKDPVIVFMTDYPRQQEQLREMVAMNMPVLCHLTIDGRAPVTEGKKGAAQVYLNLADEWGPQFTKELSFLTAKISALEQEWNEACTEIYRLADAFGAYRQASMMTRYINIPKYPQVALPMPTIAVPEKLKKGMVPPAVVIPSTDALTRAYQKMFTDELDQRIKDMATPIYSPNFIHYYERLPKVPMPADIARILSVVPNFRAPEMFIMRNVVYSEQSEYDIVMRVMMQAAFEEIVGTSIGERRFMERLPLEIIENIVSPVACEYSNFEWREFAGNLLLAFYHKLPDALPIIEKSNGFKLPVYCGFKKWLDQQSGDFKMEDERKPPQQKVDVAVNVGSDDQFMGFKEEESAESVTQYFCESGIRVDSYAPIIDGTLLSSLSFMISDGEMHRFSFTMSQKHVQAVDEEEEDSVDTLIAVRGVLSRDSEMIFESCNTSTKFSMLYKGAKVTFDVENDHVVMTGASKETHRIIRRDCKLIRFSGPELQIYAPDGSIQTRLKDAWKLVSSEGKGYVKRGNEWFKEPKFDTTTETIFTHFTSRTVSYRSDGLSIIHDNDKTTIVFPDGTHFDQSNNTFTHEDLPSITVTDTIRVDSHEFVGIFSENRDCELTMKDQPFAVNLYEEANNLTIQFNTLRSVMTLIDLVSGMVLNAGARRYVYYLADDWTWKVAKQLCSKKDAVQHFQDGDILDRLEACTEMPPDEIEAIFTNGHKPRLFIVDKQHDRFEVCELIDEAMAKSFARDPGQAGVERSFWMDTEPKSFRLLRSLSAISPEVSEAIRKAYAHEVERLNAQRATRASVTDPKWQQMKIETEAEEQKMLDVYKRYGIKDPMGTE